jgi:hypothetical protein
MKCRASLPVANHARQKRPRSAGAPEEVISARIAAIHLRSPATYGTPTSHPELQDHGLSARRKRTARLMPEGRGWSRTVVVINWRRLKPHGYCHPFRRIIKGSAGSGFTRSIFFLDVVRPARLPPSIRRTTARVMLAVANPAGTQMKVISEPPSEFGAGRSFSSERPAVTYTTMLRREFRRYRRRQARSLASGH